jgi:hypothetical protein
MPQFLFNHLLMDGHLAAIKMSVQVTLLYADIFFQLYV